eukprot:TRINITY_DN3277_c0_g1_i3.p1 TRINITY_DN3277_c0_g1~~TRINITY_DN3277_c0_g1_i3.p1  ORF type:complete len:350 (-),score=59.98 TRINITY_DN3277_c0_g1_i3:106-1155(-)
MFNPDPNRCNLLTPTRLDYTIPTTSSFFGNDSPQQIPSYQTTSSADNSGVFSFRTQLPYQIQLTQPQAHPVLSIASFPSASSNSAPFFSHHPLAFSVYPLIPQNRMLETQGSDGGSSFSVQPNIPTLNTTSSYEALSHPSARINCPLTDCLLCKKGPPANLAKSPSWISMLRVVLFCLSNSEQNANKEYFSLKDDVYDFIIVHWHLLCGSKSYKGRSWHKQVQDILSHTKDIFESGVNELGQKGFWRLKVQDDPWGTRNIFARRKGSKPSTGIPTPGPLVRIRASNSHIDASRAYRNSEKQDNSNETMDNDQSNDSDGQDEVTLHKRRRFTDTPGSDSDYELEGDESDD